MDRGGVSDCFHVLASHFVTSLRRYERSRTVPIHTTLYHVNCHAVLTDDPCFRIAYNTGSSTLTVTLVEPEKAPEALGNAAEGYVTDYIRCEGGCNAAAVRRGVCSCPGAMV